MHPPSAGSVARWHSWESESVTGDRLPHRARYSNNRLYIPDYIGITVPARSASALPASPAHAGTAANPARGSSRDSDRHPRNAGFSRHRPPQAAGGTTPTRQMAPPSAWTPISPVARRLRPPSPRMAHRPGTPASAGTGRPRRPAARLRRARWRPRRRGPPSARWRDDSDRHPPGSRIGPERRLQPAQAAAGGQRHDSDARDGARVRVDPDQPGGAKTQTAIPPNGASGPERRLQPAQAAAGGRRHDSDTRDGARLGVASDFSAAAPGDRAELMPVRRRPRRTRLRKNLRGVGYTPCEPISCSTMLWSTAPWS